VRPLLEQLADELVDACGEGMVPDPLGPGQVWLRPDGTVHLLDLPFGEDAAAGAGPAGEGQPVRGPYDPPPHSGPAREEAPAAAAAQRRALALLGQVAVLALEGPPRVDHPGGRAPVPGHAGPLLARLAGRAQPYESVAGVRADLQALRDRPTEVSRRRRLAHLGVLSALLFVGLSCCMLPAGWAVGLMQLFFLPSEDISEGEKALQALRQEALLEAGVTAVNPDPLVRLRGVAQLQADYSLRAQLERRLEDERRFLADRAESLSLVSRQLIPQWDEQGKGQVGRPEAERSRAYPDGFGPPRARYRAMRALAGRPAREGIEGLSFPFWLPGLLGWPACWVAWAFLSRGGLSYRLTGIALVRADGRPASRLQCAWRALVVWAPVTALLVLACWLDTRYWSAWEPNTPNRWMLAAASASWYAAVGLLLAYVGLALWRPTRAPHDRLAGTYLVPR
jgi:hypothetical protein